MTQGVQLPNDLGTEYRLNVHAMDLGVTFQFLQFRTEALRSEMTGNLGQFFQLVRI
jgi:hypothetical protein